MRNDIFIESDIRFSFHAAWKVRKYDAHPFYQAMSGVGMRAVDFVGINNENELFLMEVKNYRNRPEKERERILEKISLPKPPLAETLTQKMEETQAGIRAISTYLNKKWWYRMYFILFDRPIFQTFLLRRDRLFWMKAQQILADFPERVQYLLWLELPSDLENSRAHIVEYFYTEIGEEIELYHSGQFSTQLIQEVDFQRVFL
ncbi:MAG: hypothetical protein AAF849_11330 [Bacteroidota bacterium]